MKKCTICGEVEISDRSKYCSNCKKSRKREYAKEKYAKNKENGILLKRYGTAICPICGKTFTKNRPDQVFDYNCYLANRHKTVENYNEVVRSSKANTLGRQTILDLGFRLDTNLCIHHIDEDPSNNHLNNLMIISKSNHAKLHRFLENEWSLLLKSNSSNLENCWNILRGQLTTTWLETVGVNVIKIIDIGQSAAEPLNKENIYIFAEEGSETMYQTPKDFIQGEDIVQTQNQ